MDEGAVGEDDVEVCDRVAGVAFAGGEVSYATCVETASVGMVLVGGALRTSGDVSTCAYGTHSAADNTEIMRLDDGVDLFPTSTRADRDGVLLSAQGHVVQSG